MTTDHLAGHKLEKIVEGEIRSSPFEWSVWGYVCSCGAEGVAQSRVITTEDQMRERAKTNHSLHALRAATAGFTRA